MSGLGVVCVQWDGVRGRGVGRKALKAGYNADWVNRLYRGFKRNLGVPFRFICITHNTEGFEEEIEVVPFIDDTRTWWCVNELMRPDLDLDRRVICGLDTIICGPLDDVVTSPHPVLLPWSLPSVPNNGFCVVDRSSADLVWTAVQEGGKELQERYQFEDRLWGAVLGPLATWTSGDVFHGRICHWEEWKKNIYLRGPKGEITALDKSEVSVVYFSRHVKPYQIEDRKLLEHWV